MLRLQEQLRQIIEAFPKPSHGIDVQHPLTFNGLMKEVEDIEEWLEGLREVFGAGSGEKKEEVLDK